MLKTIKIIVKLTVLFPATIITDQINFIIRIKKVNEVKKCY